MGVRRKSLKWLSLILLLIFSFNIVNVSFASSSTLFVDPPELRDDTKQAPSTFTVRINVSEVSDLYTWQVNMSWNPSIVNASTVTEEDFLKGPLEFDTHPYSYATLPYAQQTEVPTTNNTITPGWLIGQLPFHTMVECVNDTDDNRYAYSITNSSEEEFGDFGFNTGVMSTVARLEVGVRARTGEGNLANRDMIAIQVTNNGGGAWGTVHNVIPVYNFLTTTWVDITSDFPWTPAMLSNANFKVRMRHHVVNTTDTGLQVDYLPVRATDTIIVSNPTSAYDKGLDSYASFRYSQTDGNFTVHDFSHDFPSDATDPYDEQSTITQVDFTMRYNTTASTLGDRYKIAYYVEPSATETVLVDWTSSGTSLATYTWANQSEPNSGAWDWLDISDTRIVVETDQVGSDPNAVFREYEAWLTVHYLRPTTKAPTRFEPSWCLLSVQSQGSYPGVSGNGTLASIDFNVLAYGETVLNITHATTYALDSNGDPMTVTIENGYFSNAIPGDFDLDKDVDPDDYAVFAGAYGSSTGQPSYNPQCDFDNDGDIDPDDYAVFAGNYGKSVP
jgi:hypothetical protein